MKLQEAPSTKCKVVKFPASVTSYLRSDNGQNGALYGLKGGLLKDTQYAWLSWGPNFEVIRTSNGAKVAAWTFGAVLRDFRTKVTCVAELPCNDGTGRVSQFVVGLECDMASGMICVFDIRGSKVLRAIHMPSKVTSVSVLDCGSGGCYPLPQLLSSMTGILAVGLAGGEVLLIDLCRVNCDEGLNVSGSGELRDELHPCQLVPISVQETDQETLEYKRVHAARTGDHLSVVLNEIFLGDKTFLLPLSDGNTISIQRRRVDVTALMYIPRIASVVVGFNFGSFQIWNVMQLILVYISPTMQDPLPIISIEFQEPCDDPRNFCYLWTVHSTLSSHKPRLPFAVMHSLCYQSKEWVDSYGYLYQDFMSCSHLFDFDLGEEDNGIVVIGGRSVACHSINKLSPAAARKQNTRADLDDSIQECDLTLCLFVWETWGATSPGSTRMALFDLNQWYKEMMPGRVVKGQASTYLTVFSLDEVVEAASSGANSLLDVKIDPASLSQFTAVQSLEEHFYPSALAFESLSLLGEELVMMNHPGVQRDVLSQLETTGPSALLHPTKLFHHCIAIGLKPVYTEVNAAFNYSMMEQREFIMSVSLEYQLVGFLSRCASEWMNGSQSAMGCTLAALLKWGWQRATVLKTRADSLCIPLYDHSGVKLDSNSYQLLDYCGNQLHHLTTLFQGVLKVSKNPAIRGVGDLSQQATALELVAVYIEVVEWFVNVGLLPEYPCDDIPLASPENGYESSREFGPYRVPYPAAALTKIYQNRRTELERLSRSAADKTDILFIDGLVKRECNRERLSSLWERDGGTGLYPPPSIQSLLRTYLLEDIPMHVKHCIVIYVFLDLTGLLESQRYSSTINQFIKFPSAFRLTPSFIKITQALWLLDHQDYTEAIDMLLDPLVSMDDLKPWQHQCIVRAFLYQGQHQMALKYIRVQQPPLKDIEDIRLNLTVLLVNGLIHEAFQYQRQHCNEQNAKDLLQHFYSACQQMNQLSVVLQLALSPVEEEAFAQFLQSCHNPRADDMRVMYYLERSRITEAMEVNDSIRSSKSHLESGSLKRGRTEDKPSCMRDTIVQAYANTLPSVTRKLAQYCAQEKSCLNNWKQVTRPTPMSVAVHRGEMQPVRYRSSLIQATLEKARETWSQIFQPPAPPSTPAKRDRSSMEKPSVEMTPFLCTPRAASETFGFTRDVTAVVFPTLTYPSPKSDDEMTGGSPVKRFRYSDHYPSSLGIPVPSQRKRLDRYSSMDATSLLQTPHVRRRTPSSVTRQQEQHEAATSIFTPQSILKVRKLVRHSVSTDDVSQVSIPSFTGTSTTAEQVDVEEEDQVKEDKMEVSDDEIPTARQIRFSLPSDLINSNRTYSPENEITAPVLRSTNRKSILGVSPRKALPRTLRHVPVRFGSESLQINDIRKDFISPATLLSSHVTKQYESTATSAEVQKRSEATLPEVTSYSSPKQDENESTSAEDENEVFHSLESSDHMNGLVNHSELESADIPTESPLKKLRTTADNEEKVYSFSMETVKTREVEERFVTKTKIVTLEPDVLDSSDIEEVESVKSVSQEESDAIVEDEDEISSDNEAADAEDVETVPRLTSAEDSNTAPVLADEVRMLPNIVSADNVEEVSPVVESSEAVEEVKLSPSAEHIETSPEEAKNSPHVASGEIVEEDDTASREDVEEIEILPDIVPAGIDEEKFLEQIADVSQEEDKKKGILLDTTTYYGDSFTEPENSYMVESSISVMDNSEGENIEKDDAVEVLDGSGEEKKQLADGSEGPAQETPEVQDTAASPVVNGESEPHQSSENAEDQEFETLQPVEPVQEEETTGDADVATDQSEESDLEEGEIRTHKDKYMYEEDIEEEEDLDDEEGIEEEEDIEEEEEEEIEEEEEDIEEEEEDIEEEDEVKDDLEKNVEKHSSDDDVVIISDSEDEKAGVTVDRKVPPPVRRDLSDSDVSGEEEEEEDEATLEEEEQEDEEEGLIEDEEGLVEDEEGLVEDGEGLVEEEEDELEEAIEESSSKFDSASNSEAEDVLAGDKDDTIDSKSNIEIVSLDDDSQPKTASEMDPFNETVKPNVNEDEEKEAMDFEACISVNEIHKSEESVSEAEEMDMDDADKAITVELEEEAMDFEVEITASQISKPKQADEKDQETLRESEESVAKRTKPQVEEKVKVELRSDDTSASQQKNTDAMKVGMTEQVSSEVIINKTRKTSERSSPCSERLNLEDGTEGDKPRKVSNRSLLGEVELNMCSGITSSTAELHEGTVKSTLDIHCLVEDTHEGQIPSTENATGLVEEIISQELDSNERKVRKTGSRAGSVQREDIPAEESDSHEKKARKGGSRAGSVQREDIPEKESDSHEKKARKGGSRDGSVQREDIPEKESDSHEKKARKGGSRAGSVQREDVPEEESDSHEKKARKGGSRAGSVQREDVPEEESDSHEKKARKGGSRAGSVQREDVSEEELDSNEKKVRKAGSRAGSVQREDIPAEESDSNEKKVRKAGSRAGSVQREDIPAEESDSNEKKVRKAGSRAGSVQQEDVPAEESDSNEKKVRKAGSRAGSVQREDIPAEESDSNEKKVRKAGSRAGSVQREYIPAEESDSHKNKIVESNSKADSLHHKDTLVEETDSLQKKVSESTSQIEATCQNSSHFESQSFVGSNVCKPGGEGQSVHNRLEIIYEESDSKRMNEDKGEETPMEEDDSKTTPLLKSDSLAGSVLPEDVLSQGKASESREVDSHVVTVKSVPRENIASESLCFGSRRALKSGIRARSVQPEDIVHWDIDFESRKICRPSRRARSVQPEDIMSKKTRPEVRKIRKTGSVEDVSRVTKYSEVKEICKPSSCNDACKHEQAVLEQSNSEIVEVVNLSSGVESVMHVGLSSTQHVSDTREVCGVSIASESVHPLNIPSEDVSSRNKSVLKCSTRARSVQPEDIPSVGVDARKIRKPCRRARSVQPEDIPSDKRTSESRKIRKADPVNVDNSSKKSSEVREANEPSSIAQTIFSEDIQSGEKDSRVVQSIEMADYETEIALVPSTSAAHKEIASDDVCLESNLESTSKILSVEHEAIQSVEEDSRKIHRSNRRSRSVQPEDILHEKKDSEAADIHKSSTRARSLQPEDIPYESRDCRTQKFRKESTELKGILSENGDSKPKKLHTGKRSTNTNSLVTNVCKPASSVGYIQSENIPSDKISVKPINEVDSVQPTGIISDNNGSDTVANFTAASSVEQEAVQSGKTDSEAIKVCKPEIRAGSVLSNDIPCGKTSPEAAEVYKPRSTADSVQSEDVPSEKTNKDVGKTLRTSKETPVQPEDITFRKTDIDAGKVSRSRRASSIQPEDIPLAKTDARKTLRTRRASSVQPEDIPCGKTDADAGKTLRTRRASSVQSEDIPCGKTDADAGKTLRTRRASSVQPEDIPCGKTDQDAGKTLRTRRASSVQPEDIPCGKTDADAGKTLRTRRASSVQPEDIPCGKTDQDAGKTSRTRRASSVQPEDSPFGKTNQDFGKVLRSRRASSLQPEDIPSEKTDIDAAKTFRTRRASSVQPDIQSEKMDLDSGEVNCAFQEEKNYVAAEQSSGDSQHSSVQNLEVGTAEVLHEAGEVRTHSSGENTTPEGTDEITQETEGVDVKISDGAMEAEGPCLKVPSTDDKTEGKQSVDAGSRGGDFKESDSDDSDVLIVDEDDAVELDSRNIPEGRSKKRSRHSSLCSEVEMQKSGDDSVGITGRRRGTSVCSDTDLKEKLDSMASDGGVKLKQIPRKAKSEAGSLIEACVNRRRSLRLETSSSPRKVPSETGTTDTEDIPLIERMLRLNKRQSTVVKKDRLRKAASEADMPVMRSLRSDTKQIGTVRKSSEIGSAAEDEDDRISSTWGGQQTDVRSKDRLRSQKVMEEYATARRLTRHQRSLLERSLELTSPIPLPSRHSKLPSLPETSDEEEEEEDTSSADTWSPSRQRSRRVMHRNTSPAASQASTVRAPSVDSSPTKSGSQVRRSRRSLSRQPADSASSVKSDVSTIYASSVASGHSQLPTSPSSTQSESVSGRARRKSFQRAQMNLKFMAERGSLTNPTGSPYNSDSEAGSSLASSGSHFTRSHHDIEELRRSPRLTRLQEEASSSFHFSPPTLLTGPGKKDEPVPALPVPAFVFSPPQKQQPLPKPHRQNTMSQQLRAHTMALRGLHTITEESPPHTPTTSSPPLVSERDTTPIAVKRSKKFKATPSSKPSSRISFITPLTDDEKRELAERERSSHRRTREPSRQYSAFRQRKVLKLRRSKKSE